MPDKPRWTKWRKTILVIDVVLVGTSLGLWLIGHRIPQPHTAFWIGWLASRLVGRIG